MVIGSLEGNFDPLTPDFAANVFVHASETNGNGIDDDGNGWADDRYGLQPGGTSHHATITASVAVAVHNNDDGIAGVAGESQIVGAHGSSIVDSIEYLLSVGARAAYNSSGFLGTIFNTPSQLDALRCAIQNKLLLVFSDGNTQDNDSPSYGSDDLLLVAGTKEDGSNYFGYGPYVDLAGQAQYIPIARGNGTYGVADFGMSYVMPQGAALAALIWSVWPDYSTEQVVARMLGTTSDAYLATDAIDLLDDGLYGAGRYDAGAAVEIAPPTFDPDLVRFNDSIFGSSIDEPIEQIWLFSRQLFSIESFTNPSNWELRWAGEDDVFDSNDVLIPIEPMPT